MDVKPLIDFDMIRYEVGACGQFVGDDGQLVYRSFDSVEERLNLKIAEICRDAGGTEPPLLFITNDANLQARLNRRAAKEGRSTTTFIPNFRHEVATVKPYKANRKADKPYHFDNITVYAMANYDTRIANGYEADDDLGAYQCASEYGTTVICSRDKDLRMIPGWQYSWECGKQPEFGPEEVGFGHIALSGGKIKGVGIKFFFAQMLTGDSVDNIPGLPRCGPVKAYELLRDCETEKECVAVVRQAYVDKYEEKAAERLQEQSQLLWIAREIVDGKVVGYKPGGS